MNRLARAAHAYAERGIAVFPLMAREKKPYPYSTGLLASSADVDLTDARWLRGEPLPLNPDAVEKAIREGRRPPKPPVPTRDSNIGIATGPTAGFWVFDVDGPEGAAALEALEAVHGRLPATPEQRTARGRHICFAWPDPAELGFEIRNSASKLGDHIDVRGAGGYIVAAPSLHPGDKDKGIAPGFEYRWAEGLSPWSIAFAPAPDWLLELMRPAAPAAPTPGEPRKARRIEDGRATPYAEKALTNAVNAIRTAAPGTQDETVFWRSYGIGRLIGAGEIERGYAEPELVRAGLAMAAVRGKVPTLKGISGKVMRAIERGEGNPAARHERRSAAPIETRPAQARSAADQAGEIRDARGLWESARPAQVSPVLQWLAERGLDLAGLPDALDGMRVHPAAPWNAGGLTGPALLAPLVKRRGDPVDALAVLALHEDCERFCHFLGETDGRAVLLSGWSVGPTAPFGMVVAIDLQDAWALGAFCRGRKSAHKIAVVPTLRSFAGGILGDRFGRVDPMSPRADPAVPAWTCEPEKAHETVNLAVRTDLRTPEFKVRGPGGRSVTRRLEGSEAARFWGSVSEQHWRAAGANTVRILQPRSGEGFNRHGE